MTYFSGFRSHQLYHANFKRIHHDSQETKPCHVESDTKIVNRGFLSSVSMGLILNYHTIITQLFYPKLLPRSLKID